MLPEVPSAAPGKFAKCSTSPHDTLQIRDYEQLTDGQLKLWGEALLGGTWQKLYDVTCTR